VQVHPGPGVPRLRDHVEGGELFDHPLGAVHPGEVFYTLEEHRGDAVLFDRSGEEGAVPLEVGGAEGQSAAEVAEPVDLDRSGTDMGPEPVGGLSDHTDAAMSRCRGIQKVGERR
jgi:hypothetical protein